MGPWNNRTQILKILVYSFDTFLMALYTPFCINLYNIFLIWTIFFVQPISSLAFIGKSDYVVTTSQGSNAQVAVWSMSKLSVSWSYKLKIEGLYISCLSYFAAINFRKL